jgi:hypothetical protein
MRYLAVSRFRQLTIVRSATPTFVLSILPPVLATLALTRPEADFRETADFTLAINAAVTMMAWVLHTLALAGTTLMSGKVRTAYDFVLTAGIPDLMDTAPVGDGSRFWGEALGTLRAAAVIHLCCLPLLAAVGVLSPLPTPVLLSMETTTLVLTVLASAGAAWQRRAQLTKYSSTRGPRNVFVVASLALVAVVTTTRPGAFRDAILDFLVFRPSPRGWDRVMATIDSPALLVILLALLYAGTITYYYLSATRKQVWEN